MKHRKFVAMTNIEYAVRHCGHTPAVYINPENVLDCPCDYKLQNHALSVENALSNSGITCDITECAECWNLPAMRNGRWILKEVK